MYQNRLSLETLPAARQPVQRRPEVQQQGAISYSANDGLPVPVYRRTHAGNNALQQRQGSLSARQRQALLLTGQDNALAQAMLAGMPEQLAQLLAMGMVELAQPVMSSLPASPVFSFSADYPAYRQPAADLDAALDRTSTAVQSPDQTPDMSRMAEVQPEAEAALSGQINPQALERIRTQMVDWLRQSCGLLGAGLATRIKHATTLAELCAVQGQWRTALLDSRHDRIQISQWTAHVQQALKMLTQEAC